MMNLTERMNTFLLIAARDERLSPMHVSLYLILCVIASRGVAIYFSISRREVMQLMRITGLATYHKTIRQLHEFGYIEYVPSFHPVLASVVKLNDFGALIK